MVAFSLASNAATFNHSYWVPFRDELQGPSGSVNQLGIVSFDGTNSVAFDYDHDGTIDEQITLDRGQAIANTRFVEGTHITSTSPLEVSYLYIYSDNGTYEDGGISHEILPEAMFGTDYWLPISVNRLCILSPVANNEVFIDWDHDGSVDESLALGQGQTIRRLAPAGTHIWSLKPIYVVGANHADNRYDETFGFSLIPSNALAREYYFPRQHPHAYQSALELGGVHVIAVQNNTVVDVNGSQRTLQVGEVYFFPTTAEGHIQASKEVFAVYKSRVRGTDIWAGVNRFYEYALPLLPASVDVREFVLGPSGTRSGQGSPSAQLSIVSLRDNNLIKIDCGGDGVLDLSRTLQKGQFLYFQESDSVLPCWSASKIFVESEAPVQVATTYRGWWLGITESTWGNAVLGNISGAILDTNRLPLMTISDAAVREGNSGMTSANFNIMLSAPGSQYVSVEVSTTNDTAFAGSDYTATNGIVVFNPGETNKTVTVSVLGDMVFEPDEMFLVVLSNPTNVTIARSQGMGTILNDDANPIPNVRIVTPPNNATFTAGTNITIVASADGGNTNVANVEFFQNNLKIGEAATGPNYSVVWSNVALGTYTLIARVINGLGLMATSAPVNVYVQHAPVNCEYESVRLDFENGVLDPRAAVTTVGSIFYPPGIKPANNFGSTKAFGFGRSVCGANCFDSYATTLKIVLPAPTYVSAISFKEMELFGNWGSGGQVFLDGVVVSGGGVDFGRLPSNDLQADTSYRVHEFLVNRTGSNITLRVSDITSTSEIFIDDLVITAVSSAVPAISTQPQSQSVTSGTNVVFTVAVSSAIPLHYQWLFNTTIIPGATNASLTVSNAQPSDAGNYEVVVENCSGPVNSRVATLAVTPPNLPPNIAITTPTNNATFVAGTDLSVTADASDADGTVTNVSFFAGAELIGGATNAPFNMIWSNVPTGSYTLRARAADNGGLLSTSAPVTITITEPPPKCVAICDGLVAWWPGDGNTMDIVSGRSGILRNGAGFAPGLVGQAFQFDGVDDFVEIANDAAPSFPAGSAFTIEMWVYRTSGAFPQHFYGKRVGCTGSQTEWNYMEAIGGGALSLADVPLRQWTHIATVLTGTRLMKYIDGVLSVDVAYQNPPPNNASLLIGGSGACATFGGLIDELAIFNRALSVSEIQSIYAAGSAGKCKQLVAPSITRQPEDVVRRVGEAATFVVEANGVPAPGYQWYFGNSALPGQTNATLTLSDVQPSDAGDYFLTVQNCFGSANSRTAKLTIQTNLPPAIVITTPTNNAIFSAGGNISIVAEASDADGTVTNVSFFAGASHIGRSTNSAFSLLWSNVPVGNYTLTARAADDGGLMATSSPVNISVVAVSGLTNVTVCTGETAIFGASVAGGGVSNYAWRHDGMLLPGETNTTLILTAVTPTQAGLYSFEANGNLASSATLIVRTNVSVAAMPDEARCEGGSVTFTAVASGTGPLTFLWKKDGVVIPNATNNSFTIPAVVSSNAGVYAVEATGPCNAASTSATLALNATPLQDLTVCPGQSATFNTAAAVGAGPATYTWKKDGNVLPGRTNSWLTIANAAAADSGTYSVEVSGCSRVTNSASLTVRTLLSATMPTNTVACSCSDYEIGPVVTGTGPFQYIWKKHGAVLPNQTNIAMNLGKANTVWPDVFTVEITGPCNCATNRTTVSLINVTSAQWTNSDSVDIPEFGSAGIYPSQIHMQCAPGPITELRVTLRGLSHNFPDDLDILLVGPDGTAVTLMSDAGGGTGHPLMGVDLTFDDNAAEFVPDDGLILSGSYKPANYLDAEEGPDFYPAPAPPSGNAAQLSAFLGSDPNGDWSLYIKDDHGNIGGSLTNGWVLDFGSAQFLYPAPSLTELVRMENGSFQMKLNGQPNKLYFIEASADLHHWDLVQTHLLGGASATIIDTLATQFGYRFYRASQCRN